MYNVKVKRKEAKMKVKNTKKTKKFKNLKRNPYQKRKHVLKRKTKKIKKAKVSTELGKDGLSKRPRGRPKKNSSLTLNVSANINANVSDNASTITGKKRGRPKKILPTEYKKEEVVIPSKPMKTLKLAGYCPECKSMLVTEDIDNGVFICYKCKKTGKESDLSKEAPKKDIPKSKKEYLQTVHSTTYDDVDHYHAPAKESDEKAMKEVEDTIEEVEEATVEENASSPIENVESIEASDLEDIEDIIETEEHTIIKTDEDLTIEKKLKDFLDKDEE